MCNIYAKADTMLYESRTRSLRIRLENHFWDVLAEMASHERFSTNQLIVKLHDELMEYRDETTNFTSFLRVCCLRYMSVLAGRLTAPEHAPENASEPVLRAVR